MSAGYDCPEAGRFRVDVLGGRLCLGIIPEGAGFTLLARGDKHALHMLRDDDKGIASLNENGKKNSPTIGAAKMRSFISFAGKDPLLHPPSSHHPTPPAINLNLFLLCMLSVEDNKGKKCTQL